MKHTARNWLKLSLLVGLAACGDTNPEPSSPPPAQPEPSAMDEGLEPCDVPSEESALLDYLRSGAYKDFARESAPHKSTGPHGGRVLTYVNDQLAASLDAGAAEHPRCAASVKELFLGKDEVSGWAVFVKTQDESQGGRGYYWLEVTRTDATRAEYEGDGIGVCVGCHSAGRDYFRAPWPLQ